VHGTANATRQRTHLNGATAISDESIYMEKVHYSPSGRAARRLPAAGSIRAAVVGCALLVGIASRAEVSIEIDLQDQRAYLLRDRYVVRESPISSGRAGFRTPTGNFKVIEKDRTHASSIYGKIIDHRGRTLVADADIDMPLPSGARFVPAPMHYFIRFDGPNGLHAGYLPGYPASHGCVRLPKEHAIAFYNAVDVGSRVTVFGRTPPERHRDLMDDWRIRDPFYSPDESDWRRRRPWPFGW
jgi:hypothetical protein